MHVGGVGKEWIIDCRSLGTNVDAWHEPRASTPVVRIGIVESYARYYSFLISDRNTGEALIDVRAVSCIAGLEPTLLVESDRIFVLTDGWVAEVDAASKTVVWESLDLSPVIDAWALPSGALVVVSELEVVSFDRQGKRIWEVTLPSMAMNHRRSAPLIHITGDDGGQVVLDETTGARVPQGTG